VRAVLTTAGVLVGVWVAVVALAWGFQRQLIYLPDRAAPSGTPADVEEVRLTTSDDLQLTAWFVRADRDPASVVLVTPGNAGNRALRLPLARGLAARGHDVLLLEYRGYGGNPGRPHEPGLVRDAVAAWEHLADRPDVDADRLVLLGESIGTGVAAAVAAQLTGSGDPVAPGEDAPAAAAAVAPAAVVLRSPFPTLADVAAGHYPFLPVRLLLRERFPVTEHLRQTEAPILVVAGGADTIVPTARSQEVAAAVDAHYVELAGVDHNDAALLDGAAYLDAVDGFVREALDRGGN
jgi:uncharacterized protein